MLDSETGDLVCDRTCETFLKVGESAAAVDCNHIQMLRHPCLTGNAQLRKTSQVWV